MAWAYLVGGDGDGQFFQWDLSEHVPLLRPRGEMLRGPGRWVYQATGRHVSGAHGSCEVYEAHGQWVPYEEQDEQQDQEQEGGQGAGEMAEEAACPCCAARGEPVVEQVCAAKQELAQEFFAHDPGSSVTVKAHIVVFEMGDGPAVIVWWRISDEAFTSLVAYRGSYGRGPRSSGLGDVMTRLGEVLRTFEGSLGDLTLSPEGTFSIRQIA